MNLIDHKKLFNLNVECFGKNSPVLTDVINAVSLSRTEIQAEKIALAYAAPPGTKSMTEEIMGAQYGRFQIFYGVFFYKSEHTVLSINGRIY